MPTRAVLCAMLLLPGTANAKDLGCKGNPKLTGACYQAIGEIMPSADIGYVFGLIGSHESKAIRAVPKSDKDMPSAVADILHADFSATITGDFVVCPIPEQPSQFHRHEVQFVCIDSAKNVVVQSNRMRVEPSQPLNAR